MDRAALFQCHKSLFHKLVVHHLLHGGLISFLICEQEKNFLNISVCW